MDSLCCSLLSSPRIFITSTSDWDRRGEECSEEIKPPTIGVSNPLGLPLRARVVGVWKCSIRAFFPGVFSSSDFPADGVSDRVLCRRFIRVVIGDVYMSPKGPNYTTRVNCIVQLSCSVQLFPI